MKRAYLNELIETVAIVTQMFLLTLPFSIHETVSFNGTVSLVLVVCVCLCIVIRFRFDFYKNNCVFFFISKVNLRQKHVPLIQQRFKHCQVQEHFFKILI